MLNVKVGRAILVITLHGRRSEKCPPQLAAVGEARWRMGGGGGEDKSNKGRQTNTHFQLEFTNFPPSVSSAEISEAFCFCVCDLPVVPFWSQMSS